MTPEVAEVLPLPEVHPPRPRTAAERFAVSAWRTVLPGKGADVGTRIVFVQDFDGPTIGELTLRGHVGWQSFGMAVEIAGTAGVSDRWSGAGLGNTVLDVRGLFGRGSTHAIGLRGTFATGTRGGPAGPVSWWGSVPQAVVPTWSVALAYEGSTARWAWHLHVGMRSDAWWAYSYTFEIWDLAASVATVQPIGAGWSLVAEAEVLASVSPFHVRALARRGLGHGFWVDAGLAVPVLGMIEDPSLQIIGKVERRW